MMCRSLMIALFLLLSFPSASTAQVGSDEPRYSVDFQETSLREFIESVGRITGRDFVVDPRIQGTVSLSSQRQLTAEELYRVFQNELQVNGYAAVELNNGQVRVVPAQVSRTQPLPLASEADDSTVATAVIETQHLDATTLAQVLQPLIDSQSGTVTPWPASNLVVVTDWRDNLVRLEQLAARLDQRRDLQTDVIPLEHANADDMAQTLDTLMAREEGNQVRIVANERSNSLVVFGGGEDLSRIKRLIATLDQPRMRQRNTRVIYLENVDADSMVEVLSGLTGQQRQGSANQQAQSLMQRMSGAGGLTGSEGSGGGLGNGGGLPAADTTGQLLSGTLSNGDSDVGFAVHPSTNALVLIGPSSRLDELEAIIQQLDIRRAQIAVEAIIAEITESRARRLGLQWLFGDLSGGTTPIGGFNYPAEGQPGINAIAGAIAQDNTSQLGQLLGNLTGVTAGVGRINDSGVSFAALLTALQSDGDTNLLSTPSLTTLDNTEAYILVGQEVPFLTGSATFNENPYQIIQREDIGVSLRIRPSISSNNTIRMDIAQVVSSLAPNVQASDVVTNKREIETSVITRDGGIVILGGLISNGGNVSSAKVPLLGDIPLLGNLFQYSRNEQDKQNLMVFIRARVINSPEQMDRATGEKYRYMRAQQLLAGFEGEQVLEPLAQPQESRVQGTDVETLRESVVFPSQRSRLGSLAP